MALIDELKEWRTATSAEIDRLVAAGREIDEKWKEQERLFGDLDTAIRALDALDPPLDELRSVPEQDAEVDPDFIAWVGGECPFDADVVVDVVLGSGSVIKYNRADFWQRGSWLHEPGYVHIVAYRVSQNVLPATEEERGDQLLTAFENDHIVERAPLIDAQTCDGVSPHPEPELPEGWERRQAIRNLPDEQAEPEIPDGFTKWEGGECPVAVGTKVRVKFRADWAGDPETYGPGLCEHVVADEGDTINAESWQHSTSQSRSWGDIIAYRIIEAPAQPEQDASVDAGEVLNDLVDELVGDVTFSPDTVAMQTYMDGDQVVIREISAEEMYAPPPTDLWQQGYNDKLNGFEPSLAEPEYTKGYEARALIEREHSETMERAKFFEGGMMADADRHQSDQRSIVEKIGGLFKREREDA